MFGVVPAYGFYIRHAQGIKMDDVDDDRRPAFVLDDVHDAEFHRVSARKSSDVPTFVLREVTEFRAVHSRPIPDTYVRSAKLKMFQALASSRSAGETQAGWVCSFCAYGAPVGTVPRADQS